MTDWLAGSLGPIMEWSWKIRNLSLCSIIIEHCHLVHNFPPVPEMISQIQSDPSPLGYSVFNRILEIRSLCGKIFLYCHLIQNFPPVPDTLSKIQSNPFPKGYSVFFCSKRNLEFPGFSRNVPRIFRFRFVASSPFPARVIFSLTWRTYLYPII